MSLPGANRQPSTTVPNPNAGRAPDYPNTWTVVTGNNTSKCRICEEKLRQTKWSIKCDRCNKLICPHCWSGMRERSGEQLLEGWWHNQDGCWCQFAGGLDNKHRLEIDARNKRIALAFSGGGTKRKAPDLDQSPSVTASAKRAALSPMTQNNASEQQTPVEDDDDSLFVGQEPAASDNLAPPTNSSFGMMGQQHNTATSRRSSDKPQDGDSEESMMVSPRTPVRSQQVPKVTKSGKKAQLSPDAVEHLDGKTTVVVGSGIIGLSVALELAIHAQETGTQHKIVVVEIRGEHAQLASQHCAGVISRYGLPEVYDELYRIGSEAWSDLVSDEYLAKKFRIKPDAVKVAKSSDEMEEDTVSMPAWYGPGKEETLHRGPGDVGRISTRRYTKWLSEECEYHGVTFRNNEQPHSMERHGVTGDILKLKLATAHNSLVHIAEIDAHNVIIAAGPWSTQVVQEILSWTKISELHNYEQAVNWLRVGGKNLDDQVVILPDEDNEDESVLLASNQRREAVILSAPAQDRPNRRVPIEQTITDSETPKTKSLRELAAHHVKGYSDADISRGRSIISTGPDFRAVIDKVPTTTVDRRSPYREHNESYIGIWLAYGFGMQGTKLAPGVAKVLRRRICGQDSGIDDSAFQIPKDLLEKDFLEGAREEGRWRQ